MTLVSSNKLTDFAAFWGAFIGTVAGIIQLVIFLKDRSKIVLIPRMTVGAKLSSDPIETIPLVDFEVEVVNKGRRIAIIEEVGIYIKDKLPLFKRRRGANLIIFSTSIPCDFVQLTEGQKTMFVLRRWQDTINDIAENMSKTEVVYVKLTSGEKIKTKFKTTSLSKYETLRKEHVKMA